MSKAVAAVVTMGYSRPSAEAVLPLLKNDPGRAVDFLSRFEGCSVEFITSSLKAELEAASTRQALGPPPAKAFEVCKGGGDVRWQQLKGVQVKDLSTHEAQHALHADFDRTLHSPLHGFHSPQCMCHSTPDLRPPPSAIDMSAPRV